MQSLQSLQPKLYVEKAGFYEFFSLTYKNIFARIVDANKYTDSEYAYCSAVISSIISDINTKSGFYTEYIREKLKHIPKYSDERQDVTLFFSIIACYYEVRMPLKTFEQTLQLCRENANMHALELNTLFSKCKKDKLWEMVKKIKDRAVSESLIFTSFEFDRHRDLILRQFKLRNFYSDFSQIVKIKNEH